MDMTSYESGPVNKRKSPAKKAVQGDISQSNLATTGTATAAKQ